MKTKTILITGSTGFLGQYVLEEFKLRDVKLICPVRTIPSWSSVYSNVSWILIGTLHDIPSLELPPLQGIIHLAAVVEHTRLVRAKEIMYDVNVLGTFTICNLAEKHHCRCVVASTSGVTRNVSQDEFLHEGYNDDEDIVLKERWPYYYTKALCEKRIRGDIVWIRPSMLLGPGLHSKPRGGKFIEDWVNGKYKYFYLDGDIVYVDVRDVAPLFVKALEENVSPGSYNVGGRCEKLIDFFHRLSDLTGIQSPKVKLPSFLVHTYCDIVQTFRTGVSFFPLKEFLDPVKIEMASSPWYTCSKKARACLGYNDLFSPEKTLEDTLTYLQMTRLKNNDL